MADHDCFPLWDIGGHTAGDIDPATLPLSPALQADLLAWADSWDATLNRNDPAASGFATPAAEQAFHATAHTLHRRLSAELAGLAIVTLQP